MFPRDFAVVHAWTTTVFRDVLHSLFLLGPTDNFRQRIFAGICGKFQDPTSATSGHFRMVSYPACVLQIRVFVVFGPNKRAR